MPALAEKAASGVMVITPLAVVYQRSQGFFFLSSLGGVFAGGGGAGFTTGLGGAGGGGGGNTGFGVGVGVGMGGATK
jgi:hypothetical protein